MNDQRWNKRLLQFALPVIVLMFYLTASGHFGYTPDDTYIYLQFAKNVAHGNGPSFNAGEPTYGFTSPLWMFLIALAGKFGIDFYIAAKVLDIFIASTALVIFYLLAFEVIRESVVALLATLVFSLNVWLIRWTGTGMETSLSVFLVIAVFLFIYRNDYLLAVILSVLLTYVRPETFWLVGLILVDIFVNSKEKAHARWLAVRIFSVFVLLIIPWLVYAYFTFGAILPNTTAAKSALAFDIGDTIKETWNCLRIIAFSDGVEIAILIISGIFLIKTFSHDKEKHDSKEERFFLIRSSIVSIPWIFLVPIFYGVMHVHVVSRYLLLIIPLVIIFSFLYLFHYVMRSRLQRFSYTVMIIFAGILVLQNQITYRQIVKPGIDAFEEGMNSCLVPIGKWLKGNTLPTDAILVWDIGAIGYYSDRKICDAAGLITPQMIPLTHNDTKLENIIRGKLYNSICDVDYILHRSDVPNLFEDVPWVILVFSKPFYRMGLMQMEIRYYTLYKVRKNIPDN